MSNITDYLNSIGITDVVDILHNPDYDALFTEETRSDYPGMSASCQN